MKNYISTSISIIILTFCVCMSGVVNATNYFVSANFGDDLNNGTSAPWKTIQRAANTMVAGDTCLIGEGDYRETVIPANSGTASAPIVFMPYNNGRVTLNGSDLLLGPWTSHSTTKPIYRMSTDYKVTTNKRFHQVFVDGKMNLKARWPNNPKLDLFSPNFFALATAGTPNSFKISNLPDINWKGAKIWSLPGMGWTSKVSKIKSYDYDNKEIFFDTVSSQSYEIPKLNNRLYIYGKLNLLDVGGEWHLDQTGNFYLWTSTNDSPSKHKIEVKARNFGFNLDNKSYINLVGINFFACGFSMRESNFCSIDNGQIIYPDWYQELSWDQEINPANYSDIANLELNFYSTSQAANYVSGIGNIVKNMDMQFSTGSMILIGSTLSITNQTPPEGRSNMIANNTIHDLGFSRSDGGAICFLNTGPKNVITNNTIFNTTIPGIRGKKTKSISIKNNEIYKTCLDRTDYGSIYIDNDGSQGDDVSEISYNSIHDQNTGSAIYFDAWSDGAGQGYQIHHNTIYNIAPWAAMHVNGAPNGVGSRNLRFFNNSTYNCSETFQGWYTGPTGSFTNWSGIEVVNNIGASKWDIRGWTAALDSGNFKVGDPQYLKPDTGDLRLKTNSPCLHSGVTIPGYAENYDTSSPDQGARTGIITMNGNDSSIDVVGSWDYYIQQGMTGNDFHQASTSSCWIITPFIGNNLTWIGKKGPQMGIAWVYIDGVYVSTVDLYQANWQNQAVCFKSSGLPWGKHTMTVQCSGTKNQAASGALVSADSFQYQVGFEEVFGVKYTANGDDERLKFQGSWGAYYQNGLIYNDSRYANTANSYVDFTFTGTSIKWFGKMGTAMGKANVYIDGVFQSSIDLYRSQWTNQAICYEKSRMIHGAHTLRIYCLGSKNSMSGDTLVDVDALQYR